MPRDLDLKLMATPTLRIAIVGLGDLTALSDTQRDHTNTLASVAQRRRWVIAGQALPNGSFPAPNVPMLRDCLAAYTFAEDRPRAKRWLIRRAKALGRVDVLPEAWGVTEPDAIVAAGKDGKLNGVMVAIYPPPDVASALAGGGDGDEPIEQMHVTLAYLGTIDELEEGASSWAYESLRKIAERTQPFEAQVQGVGTFIPPGDENPNPQWYAVDAPGLATLRTYAVQALEDGGVPPRVDHDFTPHMTVRYGGERLAEEVPEAGARSWPVESMFLVVGPDKHEIPLGRAVDPAIEQDVDDAEFGGEFGSLGAPEPENNLKLYWTVPGKEGYRKIRWNTPGDFTRCDRHLRDKVGPERAKRICASWHHEVTGMWPGDKRNNAGAVSVLELEEHIMTVPITAPTEAAAPPPVDEIASAATFAPGDSVTFVDTDGLPSSGTVTEIDDTAGTATIDTGDGSTVVIPLADVTAAEPEAEVPVDVGPSVVASGAALWDDTHEFFYDPATDDTFRLAGDIAEMFNTESTQWEPTQLAPDDVRSMPSIDDAETLDTIVAAAGAPDTSVREALPEGAGGRFRIPIVIPEGIPSGDKRSFSKGALEFKEPPFPLLWQKETDEGHKRSVTVGKITSIERVEGGLGNAEGVFDIHPDAVEAARQVKGRFLTGVSGDVDQFEAELSEGEDGDVESMLINHGRLVAATLVAKPAFQEATIEMIPEDGDTPVILASAGPLFPPKAWFTKPEMTAPQMLTVDDDGRVYGLIAEWDAKHLGNPNLRPPRNKTGYKHFNRKPVRTAEGVDVTVGQLTLVGGHADMGLDPSRVLAHYDDTRSAVADVVVGENEFGIWAAGAMRSDVSPEQVRAFRASEPSGDWRKLDGRLELVACCQVNTAGFPVQARALVASGEPVALVAAGAPGTMRKRADRNEMLELIGELNTRLQSLETERENEKRAALAATILALKS